MTVRRNEGLLRPRHCANGRLAAPFEGGMLDVGIEPDPDTGSFQWFHFTAIVPAGTAVRIVNAAGSSYPRGWETAIVWWRAGSGAWTPMQAKYSDGIVSFPQPVSGPVSFALFPPWPAARLDGLAERVAASGRGRVVGELRGGLPAVRLEIGDESPSARQVWIVCGQHGGEHPALWFADGFVAALLRRRIGPGLCFHVVPVANPSGMARGHLRTNAGGQDPNRHWGGEGPDISSEVGTLVEAMSRHGVDLLVDVHTDFEMAMVYLDVLDEWMRTPAPLAAARERFEQALARRSPDFAAGRRYPWTGPPRPDLLSGMCAPAVERRFGAAAITMELPIGLYRDAGGGSGIWTPAHSRRLGRAAAAALIERI